MNCTTYNMIYFIYERLLNRKNMMAIAIMFFWYDKFFDVLDIFYPMPMGNKASIE